MIEKIDEGMESSVFLVIDKNTGNQSILKQKKKGRKQDYLFEAYVLAELEKISAKAPKFIQGDENNLYMTLVPGKMLDDQENLYSNSGLFCDIATELLKCHSVTFSGYGAPVFKENRFVGSELSWKDFLANARGLFNNDIVVKNLKSNTINLLKNYWDKHVDAINLSQGHLVHGDFSMGSIFVEGSKLAGIIDFGDAFIGDPLIDIAYFRYKEINKPYGYATYKLLFDKYLENVKENVENMEMRIIVYMIYWGLLRISNCSDYDIQQKFVDKLECVCELI